MADVITNMRVRFGADTKNYKKGLDEGKNATRQFGKTAGSALDSFAAAFGVNMSKFREGTDKLKTSLTGMTGSFKSAAAGSNRFAGALKILKSAIIATGIGALVVALGSLVSYFTKTQRGADLVSRVMKSIGAITDVLMDRLSSLGEIIFKAFSDPKKAVSDLWNAIQTNIVNRFEGLFVLFDAVRGGLKALWERDLEGLKKAANEAGTAIVQMTSGLDAEQQKNVANSIRGVVTEIKEESRAAAELEKRRQALRDREIELIEVQAKRRKELEAARLLSEDEAVSAEKRLEALTRAQELENKTLEENKAIQRERIGIMQAEIALGESTAEEYRQLAEEKAKLHQIEGESLRLQRRLKTEMNSLTNEIKKQTEEILKNRQAQTEMFKPLDSKGFEAPAIEAPQLETGKLLSGLQTNLGEAKNLLIDFSDTFEGTFEGLATSFGESMGNLISGTAGFADFGNIILSSLGDLAIQIGKMAIKTGITMAAIKKAFSNPATAVAAGVALVALGTAIKSAISSAMSSGNGSISSGTFSGNTYDSRSFGAISSNSPQPVQGNNEFTVHVSGEFRQRGSDMVATINETQKRNKYTG